MESDFPFLADKSIFSNNIHAVDISGQGFPSAAVPAAAAVTATAATTATSTASTIASTTASTIASTIAKA